MSIDRTPDMPEEEDPWQQPEEPTEPAAPVFERQCPACNGAGKLTAIANTPLDVRHAEEWRRMLEYLPTALAAADTTQPPDVIALLREAVSTVFVRCQDMHVRQ